MSARLLVVWVVVALSLVGPLQPLALAQQMGSAPEAGQAPAKSEPPAERKTDIYDAGAVAITAIGMPLKAGICALGGALGLALLVVTFGSAHRASAGVVQEGCGQKWIVRGSDIRPDPPGSQAFEWESERGR